MARSERRSHWSYQEPSRAGNPIFYIAKGGMVSILVSVIFSVFLAVISLITDLSSIERYMSYIITGATICSVFIGSAYATQQSKSMGLMIGLGVGIVYVIFSAVFEITISGETVTVVAFGQKLLMTAVAGVLGGVVGTNL
jgi:putative membrane protein (TIGR04086 family)